MLARPARLKVRGSVAPVAGTYGINTRANDLARRKSAFLFQGTEKQANGEIQCVIFTGLFEQPIQVKIVMES